MARREYKDGERRCHKRVDIIYDAEGLYQLGFYTTYHWYIDTTTIVEIGLNPPYKQKTTKGRKYFATIADAKQFIDEF